VLINTVPSVDKAGTHHALVHGGHGPDCASQYYYIEPPGHLSLRTSYETLVVARSKKVNSLGQLNDAITPTMQSTLARGASTAPYAAAQCYNTLPHSLQLHTERQRKRRKWVVLGSTQCRKESTGSCWRRDFRTTEDLEI